MVSRRLSLRELVSFARLPYEGVDLVVSARVGGAMFMVTGVLLAVLLPFQPPTAHCAVLGWVLVGIALPVTVVGGALYALGVRRPSPLTMLSHSYLGIAQIAVLVWLSGGGESAFSILFILPVLYAAAIHPLRRWATLYWATVVAVFLPVAYGEASRSFVGDMLVSAMIWGGLGLLTVLIMAYLRWQQLRMGVERAEARRLARVDALTGLGNQRSFWETLQADVSLATRTGRPLSLVLGDLDHFKQVNDEHGHREGDALLVRVARSLRATARSSDRCFRYGGEEFAVILRDQNLDGAEAAAERFRQSVELAANSPSGRLTMSCGVAELRPEMDGDALLRAADAALLMAKRNGRDRMVVMAAG